MVNASLLSPSCELEPNPNGEPTELSIFQEQIWLDEQLTPGTSVYNVPIAVHLEGTLDVDILALTLREIARRHDVLRATFPTVSHRPVQVLRDDWPALSIVEVTDSSPAQRLERVKSACEEEARRPFDLARGPIIRLTLYRMSPLEHVLFIVVHHLAFDGWSIGLFVQELASLYSAYWAGQPSPLPDLPTRYADFARDQRQRLSGAVLDGLVAFWREYLEDAPPHLALPFDHPPSSGRKYRGARHPLELDQELTAALKTFSQAEEVTVFMTLLATLATLLYRYTGQADVVIGTPIAQRRSPRTRTLLGDFVNTVVLRTDLSGGPSFRELVARSRRSTVDAYAHQELPYNMLVNALNPERDASGSSFVQVMLSLQNAPLPPFEMPGLTSEVLDDCTGRALCTGGAWYDLTVELQERSGRFVGWLEYDRDLFEPGTIARLAGHFRTLAEAAAADPDLQVADLPMLTEAERRLVVETWNATGVDYPLEICLHDHFEAQVERTPEAIALVFEQEVLSYRELNERANRLAARLRDLGVVPETLVGICMERSVEMVVALLGVLKAGGAYVPLDPEYPAERLAFMVADSDPPVLLTQRRHVVRLAGSSGRVICLDEADSELATAPLENPESGARPENLAYMIYTSGSTGKPKGAMNTHRGIVNRLLWMQDAYELDATDRVLQKTPFSFDVSVWEFFWPLMTGAALVVARPEGHRDPVYLCQIIREQRITTLHFVPSMLQIFIEEPQAVQCRRVRRVISSGEALSFELQERFFERLPDVELHNLYGPTEAAVDVSFWACRPGEGARGVPIGRPIANTQLYVLDARMAPVAIGSPGELCIGGVGVGRGYWRRPDITDQRFVADPYGQPGSRMYRTGDLARWRSDGNIEYLGRLDHQVKIRGFRIELGEIESTLLHHPAVRESVVVVRQDVPGDTRLVAYIAAHPGVTPPAPLEIRTYLARFLPEYMVPSAFVVLDALPLSPNGKVDRKALPAPDRASAASDEPFAAPRTQTELELAQIWGQVLGIDRVGIHDNFFDLGGHSLLTVQLSSEIATAFKQDHPINFIYKYPTVHQMAAILEEGAVSHAEGTQPPVGARTDLQRRSFYFLNYPALLASHLGDVPAYALGSYFDDLRDFGSIEDIAMAKIERLRVHQKEGPYRLSGYSGMALVAFEMARRLERQGQEVSLLALIDPISVGSIDRSSPSFPIWSAERFRYHLSNLMTVHPRSWLRYCQTRLFTLARRIRSKRLEKANRPDLLDPLSRLERAVLAYTPKVYPGRAMLFVSSERVEKSHGDIDLGWSAVVSGALEVHVIPGDHSSIFHESNLPILAGKLRDMYYNSLD